MIRVLCCFHVLINLTMALREMPHNNLAKHKDASKKFAGMLDELVRLHERRFEAVKTLSRLEDYRSPQELRTNQDDAAEIIQRNKRDVDSSKHSSDEYPVIIFIKRDNNGVEIIQPARQINEGIERYRSLRDSSQREMAEVNSDDDDDDEDDDNDDEGLPITRSLSNAIGSKGAKICKKACKGASNHVCHTYHCKSKMKKTFNKKCKLYCKRNFVKNKHSVSSSVESYEIYEYD